MKRLISVIAFILAASSVAPATAQVISSETTSSRIIAPIIDYTRLVRQIDRIKEALKRVDLAPKGTPSKLIASAPDYPAARERLVKESTAVLEGYLTGLEGLLADARRLAQENSALAAYYQSQIDALNEAAQSASGQERRAYEQAASQQTKDAQKIVELNTQRLLETMAKQYASTVLQAFSYQSIGETPAKTAQQARARGAILKSIYTLINVGGHLTPSVIQASQGNWGAAGGWAFGMFCGLFMESFIQGISTDSDDDDDFGTAIQYGLLTHPAVAAGRNAESRISQAQSFQAKLESSLYQDCTTSVCVYQLGADYRRFFKILADLDSSIDVGGATLESPVDVRFSKLKKFLNRATQNEAAKRPTAVFSPATQN